MHEASIEAVAASLLVMSLAGCGPAGRARATDVSAGSPGRVVVMAPAAAEMLEALGLLDRVVGVGEFGPWPGDLAELAVVGGYDSPSVETMLSLECDLLLTTASDAALGAHRKLESLGVRVLALDTSTYEGVFRSLASVGRAFDREREVAALAERMRAELDEIAALAGAAPRRRVLVVVGRDPLFVAGPGSHLDEMVRLVGGENVAHDALSPYQQMSLETILERAPEVIVDSSDNRPGAPRGRQNGSWGKWTFLPAVRDARVYQVHPGRLSIPGIRLPEMTRLMGRLVQPQLFGEAPDAELGP